MELTDEFNYDSILTIPTGQPSMVDTYDEDAIVLLSTCFWELTLL